MLGLGWRGEVVEGGLEGEANPHEGEARYLSENSRLVAGGAVSVVSAASKVDAPNLLPAGHAVVADAVVVVAALVRRRKAIMALSTQKYLPRTFYRTARVYTRYS